MKKKIGGRGFPAWIFLCLLVVYIVFGAGVDAPAGPVGERVVIAQGLAPVSALVFVATEKGYWEEEGLDVKTETFISGKICLDAVLWDQADVATVAETPVVLAAFQGKEVYVICTIAEDFLYVLGRKDARISAPADLAGKRVATLMNTSAEFFMDKFLDAHDLKRADMRVTNLRPADMIIALIRGDIDAYFIWEPNAYFAERELGANAIRFSGEGIYTETFNIVVTQEFARKHPETLKKLLRALIKAEEYVKAHKEESIEIVAGVLGMEEVALTDIWDNYDLTVKLDQSLLKYMQEQGQWALDTRIVDRDTAQPDYRSLIHVSPLKDLRPRSVSLEADG